MSYRYIKIVAEGKKFGKEYADVRIGDETHRIVSVPAIKAIKALVNRVAAMEKKAIEPSNRIGFKAK